MGPLKDILAKLPIQNLIPKGISVDETELSRIKSMIDSMTEKERLNPNLLNDSRIRRIAKGSGRAPKDVSELVNRFKIMRGIMGNVGKMGGLGGLMGKIPGMGGLGQLNDMRKMAQQMMSGGGIPGMTGPTSASPVKRIDKDKLKKVRKEAAKKRKANRKK
jgi:signal recognition particle subunit SRP54